MKAIATLLIASFVVTAACSASPVRDALLEPKARTPLVAQKIILPSRAVDVVMRPSGDGFVTLADGSFTAVSPTGALSPASRPVEEIRQWKATSAGLFLRSGDALLQVEDVRDVQQIVGLDARDTWIRSGTRLLRARVEARRPPRVTWLDPTPGVQLGAVRAIAGMSDGRGAILSDRGVTIATPTTMHSFHGTPQDGLPDTLGAGGGYAWVLWRGQVLRTDGDQWESLASGITGGPSARIAVDEGTGSTALIVDGAGSVFRIEAEEALRVIGLADGDTILDTRISIEPLAPARTTIASVTYLFDGKPFASRTAAPWGWGDEGARTTDLGLTPFGAHRVEIQAKTASGHTLTRTLRFYYSSPVGRVPTYTADISPIYHAHCASCHSTGAAVDLSRYEVLSANAESVRAAIREGRMPPDIRLDRASAAVVTSWADGNAPH